MTYTSHGHHIDGSPEDVGDAPPRAQCGGPGLCGLCSAESATWQQEAERRGFLGELDSARQHQGLIVPRKFQSKVVDIETIQFTGGVALGMDIARWVEAHGGNATWRNAAEPWRSPDGPEGHDGWPESLAIREPSGWAEAPVGSWIIRGTENEFYHITDAAFQHKYEPVIYDD